MKTYLILVGMIVMLAGCNKEEIETTADSPQLVRVEIHLTPDEPNTRSMDENSIKDVNLFLSGSSDDHFYFPSPTGVLSFEMRPGSYQAYIVTNAHRDIGALTDAALRRYNMQTQDMYANETIPMTAETQMTIDASGVPSPSEIKVKRCAAKIAYDITVADVVSQSIKLRSVQLCNIPRQVAPFGRESNSSTSKSDYFNGEVVTLHNDKAASGVFYLFENRQGVVNTITDQKDKSPENAPVCASYLRIFAQSADEIIEYVVFLGENNTSDFNVRKNTNQHIDLVIRGKNEIDSRVRVYEGLYYGTANCIICNGNQVNFDVTPYRTSKSRCYEYTSIYAGREYEAASAAVLWQGTANLISSVYLNNNSLKVSTNGKKGNAVVAVYDKVGTILWSFHIWCTSGDAPRDLLCENYKKARFYVLDRNLGAFANLPASYIDAGGLVYQWGRKDPFPSTKEDYVYTSTKSGTFLTVFPAKVYNKQELIGSIDNLLIQTSQHPATFVKVTYGDTWFDGESINLWGDPNGYKDEYDTAIYRWTANKSVYDPCPVGYRVANKFTWTGFSRDGATLVGDNNFGKTLTNKEINIIGAWNYGWRLRLTSTDTQGVYISATQYRNLAGELSANDLSALKNGNYYWSTTGGFDGRNTDPTYLVGGNCLSFQSNQLLLNNNYYGVSLRMDPGFGFSVRCVRE